MFGIIQKIFNLFLPKIYAIYGTILLNWILSITNAISDLSVFWWLYGQQHTNQAYIVLGIFINMSIYPVFAHISGIDYIPGILTVTHHLTESLNNQVNQYKSDKNLYCFHHKVPPANIFFECFLVGVLYPLAVPICFIIFIMARIRGEVCHRIVREFEFEFFSFRS